MRYQEIIKKKKRALRLLWSLTILILCLALSGWVSPIGAEVTLCGEPLLPDDSDGIYRLRGHLTCSTNEADEILYIDGDYAEFDLRGFKATGDGKITGILIEANNVMIRGGHFRKCETALYVKKTYDCEIDHFTATDSSDKAIRIRGDGNSIVKSLCLRAGNDCFELRGDKRKDENLAVGNFAERCTAINSGRGEGGGQGIQFRGPGPGSAYKCSVFGGGGEGFQIQERVTDVTIERCLAINNAQGGIEIKAGATGNVIKHNIAFANGDGIDFFDLIDENGNCKDNTWERNKFRSSHPLCIKRIVVNGTSD
jgi:parallel beta-helix repeat protein